METDELLRRAEDLAARCEKSGAVTASFFLTPAERIALERWAKYATDCTVLFTGGREECERQASFFLPYYMDETAFDVSEYIRVLEVTAGFGEPSHRDYLGAALGLGIRREWLGDIWVRGSTAHIFCLKSVAEHLLSSLEKVGRYGVKTRQVSLDAVPAPERRVKTVRFTVKSLRLDAAASGMFGLSRTETARLITAGAVTLNYESCLRTDAPVKAGDIVSLRGKGKGAIVSAGGESRKGRLFVEAEIYK